VAVVVAGKQRKYYQATEEGQKALEEAKEKLRELATEVLEEESGERTRDNTPTILKASDVEMDLLHRRVTRAGLGVPLTNRQFDLLHYFVRHKNSTVKREALMRDIWKEESGYEVTNIIDATIHQLRKKLEKTGRPRLIHTVLRVGYCLRE
jgi:DNA-binding response OmpR family regulator